MLYPLQVRIEYEAHYWKNVSVTESEIKGSFDWTRPYDVPLPKPVETNPRFWVDVVQLSFALRNGNEEGIRGFYEAYGPVLSFAETEDRKEVTERLEWFRVLTRMVSWIKEGRTGPLSDRVPLGQVFSEPQRLDFYGNDPFRGIHSMTRTQWTKDRRLLFLGPQTEEELLSHAWEACTRAATLFLNQQIRDNGILVAPEGDRAAVATPLDIWTLWTKTALPAAFLQWYFQELVPFTIATCAAEGCGKLVSEDRAKYTGPNKRTFCSDRCRERQKKRDRKLRKR